MGKRNFNDVKETYLDFLIAFSKNDIPEGWEEISKSELSIEELIEYDEVSRKFEKLDLKSTSAGMEFEYKLFRDENQRGVLGMMPKFNSVIDKISNIKDETEDMPFAIIDKIPTFPGCLENDKSCFNQKMREHFVTNFKRKLPNQLGLSSGKKRIITLFVIDKDGSIRDVKVKAPHKKLEEIAKRVIYKLPKMIPGEYNGEKRSVKYTLPLRIDVE